MSIEETIAQVLEEISQKGFSSIQPFSIGKIEVRMAEYVLSVLNVLASFLGNRHFREGIKVNRY